LCVLTKAGSNDPAFLFGLPLLPNSTDTEASVCRLPPASGERFHRWLGVPI
jgi:hypothetical protein